MGRKGSPPKLKRILSLFCWVAGEHPADCHFIVERYHWLRVPGVYFPGAMILSLSHGCGTAAMAFCIIICIMIERTEMKNDKKID